jgi:6-phosphogluconate dehydrogenase
MTQSMEFGIVGLGRMGGNLSRQALEKDIKVVALTRHSPEPDLLGAGLVEVRSPGDLRKQLRPPRAVWIYVPAGPTVDGVIEQLSSNLEAGDIIVDGGNSYWGDSIRRSQALQKKGLEFVDCGTSGGVDGARNGACFMVGGTPQAIERIEPILLKLATPGGYIHAGPPGAGHFVKLVHNGIEFGMLQAIAEGMDLLKHYRQPLNIADILHCWRNGSVIRSWLIDLMEEGIRVPGGWDKVPPYVDDTGEVNWLVDDALQMEVPVPVIAQSVMQLLASRDSDKNWARAIAIMRHGFGGHAFGAAPAVVKERREGRVRGFYRE